MNTFDQLIHKYRDSAFSERDKGNRFERLMRSFLKTYPVYKDILDQVWLWSEFPSRKDTGIDIVIRTTLGAYWAVQCKCYKAEARIDNARRRYLPLDLGQNFF